MRQKDGSCDDMQPWNDLFTQNMYNPTFTRLNLKTIERL